MPQFPLIAQVRQHAAGVMFEPHMHAEAQLSVVLRGTTTLTAEEGWWLVPPGLAIWVPPGISHAAYYSESSSLINLWFAPSMTQHLPATCRPVVVSDLLRELAREAARLCTDMGGEPEEAETAHALALMAQLMLLQVQRPVNGPGLFVPHGRDRRLRHITDLLRQDPGTALKLDALASAANTSERTLARLFVTETGMTFGRWREHLRVVTAVDKLTRGESIMSTALALGYGSASSFTTLFTRLLGVPPRRYMLQLSAQTHALPLNDKE